MICFDVTDKKSFETLSQWLDEIKGHLDEPDLVPFALVGNKIDLVNKRKISSGEAKEYGAKIGMEYFETSAKVGKNVESVFHYLASKILELNIK